MISSSKMLECPFQVENEALSHVEELKCHGVLLMSEGRMEQKIDRWISVASKVVQTLCQSDVAKREMSQKARLSVPALHGLWS